ncbi:uncharacterized protein L201_007298 [Kwoniella dendrophila CBS 6074]|uniref:Zn(2)-C6 fungal-type domain-containing protein n=1 Tax=Kwoniella dendrophila CBS 6074 TaxID=1295534 RepID=A0AAX4K5I6_9TREE
MSSDQNQDSKNLPPWFRDNNAANSGWIPSWNNVPMDSTFSKHQQQQNPHNQQGRLSSQQPQENSHWYAGQLETPLPDQNQSQAYTTNSQYQQQTSAPGPSLSRSSPHPTTSQSSSTYNEQSFRHPTSMNTQYRMSGSMPTPSSTRASTLGSPKTNSGATIPTPEKADNNPESSPTASKGKPSSNDKSNAYGNVTGKKRKRKQQVVETDNQSVPSPTEADKDKEKRTKTGRACDACRTKKIRCDILPTSESPSGIESQPICAHCKQSNLECTFFLPITETRFKKKRQAAKEAHTNESNPSQSAAIADPPSSSNRGSPDAYDYGNMGGNSTKNEDRGGGRLEGPTSIAFLLHTTIPTIPSEGFDIRHHNSWEVLEDGNGVIRVNAPPSAPAHADADPADPTRAHNRLNKPVLSGQTMSLLVNAYFKEVAPLFPVISRAEFASKSTPSPLLLYSICGLGATRRQFPREIFAGVRGVINGLLRSNDILSDARFENVQALLLLAQVGDLHAQPTAATASASLIRTSAAIRMAQDLGLHRESSLRASGPQDLAYVELRRRVWATCVIMDRWVLKMIYSPTGLKHTTDAQLGGLVMDMERWQETLPEGLQFRGRDTPQVAGLLHLGYTALQFLFWRVFMRITYSCPPHLTFCVQVLHWTKMIEWSRGALEWLDANDDALDTLFIFPYAATSCALIQYHTWARRGDHKALETLKLVKETATRWEHTVQPDQMSIRRKTCETMTLLYEAALKTDPDSNENRAAPLVPANPTAGVIPRKGGFSRVQFKKDENREGGGVFIAQSESDKGLSGLNEADVVLATELSEQQLKNQAEISDQIDNSNDGRSHPGQPQDPIEKINVAVDQRQRQNHDRDLTEVNNNSNDYTNNSEISPSKGLQTPFRGSYNVNPLINENGSYSNQGIDLNQPGADLSMGSSLTDIARHAPHYPMPNYPLQQDSRYHEYHHSLMNSSGEGGSSQGVNQYDNLDNQHNHQQLDHQTSPIYGIDDSTIPSDYENTNTMINQSNQSNHHQPHHGAGGNYFHTNGVPITNGYTGYPEGPIGTQSFDTYGPVHGHPNNNGERNLDPSFLDSLPVSTFDWESWSDYFDKFLPNANQNFETMQ